MDSNKRPYLKDKVDSIRGLFYKNTSNRIVLRNIMHELKFRETDKAKTLTKDVRGHINRTFGANVLKDIEAELRSVKTKKPKLKKNRSTNKVESISSEIPDFSALDPVKKDVLKNITFYIFVKNYPVPIRVKNMILLNMELIVFNTVYDFISADLDVQESLLEIPKFGRKSLNDLKQSINGLLSEGRDLQDLFINLSDELNSSSDYIINEDRFFVDYKLYGKNAAHLSKGKIEALKNMSLAFFVNSLDAITVRTRNAILKAEESDTPIYKSLYDFYIAPLGHRRRLLSIEFFGIGSLNNLSNCVDILVESEENLISMSSGNFKSKDLSIFSSIEDLINHAISVIGNDRCKKVIKARYLEEVPLVFDKIGVQLDVTRERARQIEVKAVKSIQNFLLGFSKDDKVLNFKEEIEGYFFINGFFVSQETSKNIVKDGSRLVELYIKASNKSLDEFLTEWFAYSDEFKGWFINENVKHESENIKSENKNSQALGFDAAIEKSKWPITPAQLSALTCLPEFIVKDKVELSRKYYLEKLSNGVFIRFTKGISIKGAVKYALRGYGRGASLSEIKDTCFEMFQIDIEKNAIGNVLGALPDGLIVGVGTYAFYEDIDINKKQINNITAFCKSYLLKEQRYISAHILLENIKDTGSVYEKYGDLSNEYILFGICQDDKSFVTKKGLILGLNSDNFHGEFLSLTQEIIDLMKDRGRPLIINEILDGLSSTRVLTFSSVFSMLGNDVNKNFEKRGNTFYLADDHSHLEVNDEDLFEVDLDDI